MMIHSILIGVSIIYIVILIIHKDYIHTLGWIVCLLVTISDWYKKEQIKSLKESIHLLRKSTIILPLNHEDDLKG